MTARFYRLYPLHFFMLVIFIILECGKWLAWKFGGFSFNSVPFTNAFAFSEIVPNFLLIHAWVPFADPFSFNSPSWSISIEFYMYALLFASISVFRSFRIGSWFVIVLLAFILIYCESDIVVIEVQRGLFCFFCGAMTYVVFLKSQISNPKSQISKFLASFVELALLVSVVFLTQTDVVFKNIIAPGLFCLTVFCFAFEAGVFSKILKARLFQFIGKRSFSIYMTHA
ncbi:acyltransferase family protein, partial [Oleiphilus sp. HI0066]|uniref:acyltransferase family protein n=2 Tax=Oleiphilus TaxID=141450 RepID=UPI00351748FE